MTRQMQTINNNAQNLFLIKNVQLDMVFDRGFSIPNDEAMVYNNMGKFMEYVESRDKRSYPTIRSFLSRIYQTNENSGRKCLVYYAQKDENDKQLSVNTVKDFIKIINSNNITEAILISDIVLSPPANTELQNLTQSNVKVTFFLSSDLKYNPTRHVDGQKHILLSREETRYLMDKMGVNLGQLPIIDKDEPISKYYGFIPPSVIKIERNDTSIGVLSKQSVNYRVVV